MTIESHFRKNSINKAGLNGVALGVGEESMMKGIEQGWFVSDLIDHEGVMS